MVVDYLRICKNPADSSGCRFSIELFTATYLFIGKKGYEAIENVRTRSEAVQNV